MKETSIEGESDEASRSNSEPFSNGGSGVACSIEAISNLSDFGTHFSHFCNTSSVVTDGSISINS